MTPTPSSPSWTRFSKPTPSPSLAEAFVADGLMVLRPDVGRGPVASAAGVIDSSNGSAPRPRLRVLPGEAGEHTGEVLRERYELLNLLGAGGMAEVYEARFLPSDSRRVAVKILRRRIAREPANIRRFAREFKILDAVEHPNLVRVRDYDRAADGRLFMVMERLEGQSLDTLGAMTAARVIAIGIQLCDVLDVLHERGVIHRDLKPSNVILLDGPRDQVKLVDLGIARLEAAWYVEDRPYLTPPSERRLTSTGVVLGTPRYVPPEAGDGPATVLWDVYALGVLLWSLACGSPPPLSWRELGGMDSAPEGQHGLPQMLERALRDAMSVDPQRRFASARELREELEVAAAELEPESLSDFDGDAVADASSITEVDSKSHSCPDRSANPHACADKSDDDANTNVNADPPVLDATQSTTRGSLAARLRFGLALLMAGCIGAVLAVLAVRGVADEDRPETPSEPQDSAEASPSPLAQPPTRSTPSLTLSSEALGCVPPDLPKGAFVDLQLDSGGRLVRIDPGPGVEVLTQLCLTQKLEGIALGQPGGKSTHRVPLTAMPSSEGEHAEP